MKKYKHVLEVYGRDTLMPDKSRRAIRSLKETLYCGKKYGAVQANNISIHVNG